MTLTKRQFQILAWIDSWIRKEAFSPSYAELCNGVGLSSSATAHKHVTNLRNKGVLDSNFNRARSIEITPLGQKFLDKFGARDHVLVQALALRRIGA